MKICRITSSVLSVLLAALILASCSGNKETDVNDGETNGSTVSDEAEIKTLPDPTEEELAEYAERIEALRKNHTEVGYIVEDRGENAIKATNIFGFSIEQGGTWVDYEEAKILPVPDFKNPFLTFANADSREVEIRLEHVTPDEVRAYCDTLLKRAFTVESYGGYTDDGEFNYFAQHENGSTVSITAHSDNTVEIVLTIE